MLQFFCAIIAISELLITVQRSEIDASLPVISHDFFQLQDVGDTSNYQNAIVGF